jgi:hypothetical protein
LPIGIPIRALSLSLRKAFHDLTDELTRCRTHDFPENGLREHTVIHAVEKLSDVRPPDETVRLGSQVFLGALDACQKTLAHAARPRVINESLVVNRNQIVVNQAVNHAVADAGDRNFPALVFVHDEFTVTAVAVCATVQVAMQLRKIALEVIPEFIEIGRCAFSPTEREPASPNIS